MKKTPSSRKIAAARALDQAITVARDHVKLAKKKAKQAKAELKAARAKLKAAKRARKEAAAKVRADRAAKRKAAAAVAAKQAKPSVRRSTSKTAKKQAAAPRLKPKRKTARIRLVRAPVPGSASATAQVEDAEMDSLAVESGHSESADQQTA